MLSSICTMCNIYGNSSPPTIPRHCFTLLLCQLDNCNALVCGLPQNRARKQYKLYCKNCIEQEKVRARYSYPHSSAFNFVSNPTIKQLTVFKVLVTSHKALNGLARGFNTDLWGRYVPTRSPRSVLIYWKFQGPTPFRMGTVVLALLLLNSGILFLLK